MGEFVRLSHRVHCGCIYDEYDELLTPCAGHRDRVVFQRAQRASVTPIHRVSVTRRFFNALNPFRKGATRQS